MRILIKPRTRTQWNSNILYIYAIAWRKIKICVTTVTGIILRAIKTSSEICRVRKSIDRFFSKLKKSFSKPTRQNSLALFMHIPFVICFFRSVLAGALFSSCHFSSSFLMSLSLPAPCPLQYGLAERVTVNCLYKGSTWIPYNDRPTFVSEIDESSFRCRCWLFCWKLSVAI